MSQSGQGLSKAQMLSLYRDVQTGEITDEQVDQLWSQIDPQTKRQAVQTALDQFVIPHLEGVKSRAKDDRDNLAIREQYAEKDDDEQQVIFNKAIGDVLAALLETRENPKRGLLALKGLLRDPFTMEGLLLIFDNEEHVDEEYSERMKEFVALHLKMAGVAITPEMYDAEAVREVYDRLDLDVQRDPRES